MVNPHVYYMNKGKSIICKAGVYHCQITLPKGKTNRYNRIWASNVIVIKILTRLYF